MTRTPDQPWKFDPAHDLGLPLRDRLRSVQRESGLLGTGARLFWWTAVRTWLAVYHRARIRGREHLPAQPPFILVANHASHLDTLLLAAALPWRLWDRTFPLAAADVFFSTPHATIFAAGLLNALPMRRGACRPGTLAEMRQSLVDDRRIFIIFPEGTRTRDGAMGAFRSGIGVMVAGTDVPVVPCLISGAWNAWRPGVRIPRPLRLSLAIGTPLRFSGATQDRQGWDQIASALETAVRSLGDAGRPGAGSITDTRAQTS